MARRPTLTVNGYSERWLRAGFPWVYPDEIEDGKAAPGTEVALRSHQGAPLGVAIADDGWIAARRFRNDEGPIDSTLLGHKLENALQLRRAMLPPQTTAWRWIHGENDGLPGVRIDIYANVAVLSLDSASLLPLIDPLSTLIRQHLPINAIYLGWRPDPREKKAFRPPKAGLIWGEATDAIDVEERGIRARVYPGTVKDIGIFPDMREIRRYLEPHWPQQRVLNLFAYTGFFSVCAAAKGAAEVVSVDLSEKYLALAQENFRLNNLPIAPENFLAEDSFKVLDRFRRQKRLFDRVIADPPGHSHSESGAWSGEKDYPRLVAACLNVLAPGGWLIACSNLGSISPKTFQGFLEEGAKKAGRRILLIHEGGAAPDFPAALDFPEGRYLKAWICVAL